MAKNNNPSDAAAPSGPEEPPTVDQASTAESPAVEQATAEQPTVERPTAEQATVEQPTEELPDTQLPPPVEARYAAQPGSALPETPGAYPGKPRIRSGAIVWGALVVAAMVVLLSFILSAQNRDAYAAWAAGLDGNGIALICAVAVGAFILLVAVLSAIKRAQLRRSEPDTRTR